MILGVFSNNEPLYKSEARKIIEILKKQKIKFEVYNNVKKAKCDILIVVGGDGTILKVVRELKRQIPILGVSKGVKFLTEIEFGEFEILLKRLLKRDYKIEERIRLACEVDGLKMPNVLNEIVVTTSKGGGVIRYSLKLDGKLVWRDSGDGVIVSTPTGSTGYNWTAGGPILNTNEKRFVITPICSAYFNKRLDIKNRNVMERVEESKIFSDDREVVIKFFRNIRNRIVPDGRREDRIYADIKIGDEVTIRRSKKNSKFVKIL